MLLADVHPFMTTVQTPADGSFLRNTPRRKSSNHLKLSSWTCQWVHCIQQWTPAPLGCGGMGDLHYGCTANKSASAVMTVWTEISKYCFQHLVECVPQRTKHFWGQTSATKAYLIKFHIHTFIPHLDTHTHTLTFYPHAHYLHSFQLPVWPSPSHIFVLLNNLQSKGALRAVEI